MSIEYGIKSIEFIKGEVSELDVFESLKSGLALGAVLKSGRVGVGFADDSKSKANAMAVMSALSAQNINVWDFKNVFLSQLSYLTYFSCLNAGIFVDSKRGSLIILGQDGINVNKSLKNKIEENLNSQIRSTTEYSNIFDMTALNGLYYKALKRELDCETDFNCTAKSSNPKIELLLTDLLGQSKDESLILRVNKFGTGVSAYTRETGLVPFSRLILICSTWEKEHENIPSNIIYKNDGLFMTAKLLHILKKENTNFSALNKAVPEYYVKRRVVNVEMNKDLCKKFKNSGYQVNLENDNIIRLKEGRGAASILPLYGGKTGVLTQSLSPKSAKKLGDDIEKILQIGYF